MINSLLYEVLLSEGFTSLAVGKTGAFSGRETSGTIIDEVLSTVSCGSSMWMIDVVPLRGDRFSEDSTFRSVL